MEHLAQSIEEHLDPFDDYMLRMWQEAAERPDDPESFARSHYAFPYVPITPEDFGLQLNEESMVVDIGTLSGYGAYDFCWRRARAGLPIPRILGIDINERSVAEGIARARHWAADLDVRFVQASAEELPCASRSVDLLIARLVLPYVDVEVTLREFARVLTRGGLALIQPHTPHYYLGRLGANILHPSLLAYYMRPVISRGIYYLRGRQPRTPWLKETALGTSALVKLCAREGMRLQWTGPGLTKRPLLLFSRA